ncbi:phosphatidate phosphatase PAH1 PWA37_002010 [Arxiozyma heterogenica]|uniref:LNS2/PITP domain-containing protein n=1 Tax=Arxiozyma heterogenica TaxID=278026 RepID=A0AAN7WS53_9SACH|nr:hypothetical protein RI543_001478 [Kazachstania heterogenica]
MQYVGRAIGSVSKTWSSINPATLSGAIDVIVVEQPDGTLACSPFHVRFGKFQILKPSQKRVEVLVNGKSTNIPMKLSDSGEAYFVFETYSDVNSIPSDLIGSPVSSVPNSPKMSPVSTNEPEEQLSLEHDKQNEKSLSKTAEVNKEDSSLEKNKIFQTKLNRRLTQIHIPNTVDNNGDILLDMEGYMPNTNTMHDTDLQLKQLLKEELDNDTDITKFIKEDSNGSIRIVNPYEHITGSGLPSTQPTKVLHLAYNSISMSEPSLVDDTEHATSDYNESILSDSASSVTSNNGQKKEEKLSSTIPRINTPINHNNTTFKTTITNNTNDSTKINNNGEISSNTHELNYIKTLRLTSDQLKCLNLNYGENNLTYSIDQGKAIITSKLFVWRWDVPIVISDIDGTITKSDALGHVLAMIGKDWTHAGVAKLFSEVSRNGYNIMYLTARSAGQADSTRSYLRSINQDGNKLPIGPVILSPDRTMAALRREVILKKPEVFKIACLNDIRSLYFHKDIDMDAANDDNEEKPTPFFAGFGNRITDALSYRTVGIPSSRIFTINTEGEVHMELLELAGYKSSYLHINELVDHFFPPVTTSSDDVRSILSTSPGSPVNTSMDNYDSNRTIEAKSLYMSNQGEKFTDVNFWREPLININDLSDLSDDSDSNKKQGDILTSSSPKNNSPYDKGVVTNSNRRQSFTFQIPYTSPSKSTTINNQLTDDNITTPDNSSKRKNNIGKQMYLSLGSPLSSPLLSSIDMTTIDQDMKKLSILKPSLPTSGVSQINVLDDNHSIHDGSPNNASNSNERYTEEHDGYEDEFDEDEFDEDEFSN